MASKYEDVGMTMKIRGYAMTFPFRSQIRNNFIINNPNKCVFHVHKETNIRKRILKKLSSGSAV